MSDTASPTTETPLPVPTEAKEIAEPTPGEAKSGEDEATPEPEKEQEPETVEGTQDALEEPEPPSFDAEVLKDNPDLKAFREEIESKAHRQGQIREAGRRKETTAAVAQVMTGINTLNKTLTDAAKDGNLADNFQEIINQSAPALNAYGQVLQEHVLANMREQNRSTAIAETIAEISTLVDNVELGQPYYERLLQPGGNDAQGNPIYLPSDEFGIDSGKEVLKDYIKDLVKSVDKKGFERGVRSRDGISDERKKATEREGEGPGEVSGSGGTTKPYRELTGEQRTKLASEGRVDQYIDKNG